MTICRRALATIATAVALSATGCSDKPDHDRRIKVDCSQTSAATVEEFARAPLPASATSLEVFCEGFMDTFVRARIVMPRRALRGFLREADFSAPPRRGSRPFGERENDPPSWQIKRAEHVLGHQEDCMKVDTQACASGLAGRAVVVDLDDRRRAIVYLRAFTS